MPRAALSLFLIVFPLSLAAGHDLTPLPQSANQLLPVITGNGSGFRAAWFDGDFSSNAIVSTAASAQGEPIDGTGTASEQKFVQSIAIAHSPSETLVAWVAHGMVFAERLSTAGMPLGTNALVSGNDFAEDVALAWNGSRYVVIWSNTTQLFCAFIATDGSSTPPRSFFGEPVVIGQQAPANFEIAPDVAWDGQHFVVVFGEAPIIPCVTLCPIPFPDHFRVMRVSATGDAIDSAPLLIAGKHIHARVASSGVESLIVLDNAGMVSTIVAHDESRLTLDAETPLFPWYSNISSGVTWDGGTYTVGWRYGVDSALNWLGMARVTGSGVPFDYRVTPTGHPVFSGNVTTWNPSLAVNDTGMTAFAISEAATASPLARARLYLASEFASMPAAPPAPRNVVSYFSGNIARIDWQSDPAAGFIIEWSGDFGNHWGLYTTVPGDRRTTSLRAVAGNQFRVRAFGPGGLSEGTITSIGSQQRRRAARQ